MVKLRMEFDNTAIALSAGIGFIGVYAAVSLCEQFRLSTVSNLGTDNKSWIVMAFGAMSLGGIGIWCLHFVAVSAFSVSLHGVDVPIRYNVGMLIISLIVVVSCQFFALWMASTDVCFNKSKKEIIEMFIARASKNYTMREIKQMGRFRILTIVCTHNLNRIFIGGVLSGSGVILMHYLGMMAMEFQGTVQFNYGAVAAVVIMSILGATGAFITFYRVLSIFPSLDILRVGIAVFGMIFMAQVHYIGLFSATYDFDPDVAQPSLDNSISAHQLLIGILVSAVVFCVIMQVYVVYDLRSWLLHTSAQLRQADRVIDALHRQHVATHGSEPFSRDLLKYFTKYTKLTSTSTLTHTFNSSSEAGTASGRLRNLRAITLYHDDISDDISDLSAGSGCESPNVRTKPQHSHSSDSRSNTFRKNYVAVEENSASINIEMGLSQSRRDTDVNNEAYEPESRYKTDKSKEEEINEDLHVLSISQNGSDREDGKSHQLAEFIV